MTDSAATEELHRIRLRVNGTAHDVTVPARRLLSDALRHDLGLTGTPLEDVEQLTRRARTLDDAEIADLAAPQGHHDTARQDRSAG